MAELIKSKDRFESSEIHLWTGNRRSVGASPIANAAPMSCSFMLCRMVFHKAPSSRPFSCDCYWFLLASGLLLLYSRALLCGGQCCSGYLQSVLHVRSLNNDMIAVGCQRSIANLLLPSLPVLLVPPLLSLLPLLPPLLLPPIAITTTTTTTTTTATTKCTTITITTVVVIVWSLSLLSSSSSSPSTSPSSSSSSSPSSTLSSSLSS